VVSNGLARLQVESPGEMDFPSGCVETVSLISVQA
jgi:hypothetical protein